MAKLLTMGETMAAFAPAGPGALRYMTDYRLRIAGAESNTAIGLAKLGLKAAWFSRLGDDEFGHFVLNQIRSEGVDCGGVILDPAHRTGVMFKQMTARETKVFYYRDRSAASFLAPEDIVPQLFDGVDALHMSGITPVLSASCREAALAAMRIARERGALVSFDPNVRRKLWGDTDCAPLIRSMALDSDIVMLGRDEAELLLGSGEPDAAFDALFSGGRTRYAALKDGANGAWVADRERRVKIPPYPCRCVDPVGAGDGFNAGFLAGILGGRDLETAGRMGGVCGALATETTGDTEGYPDGAALERLLRGGAEVFR